MWFVLTTFVAATPACAVPYATFDVLVVPEDGSIDVPTNVKPVVSGAAQDLELVVVDTLVGFEVVEFETEDGFGRQPWQQLVLNEELPAGARVSVRFDGEERASFFAGGARDDETPTAPAIESVEPFTDGACEPYVQVTANGDALLLGSVREAPVLEDGTTVHGIGRGGSVVVGGEADARETVLVVTVDLAGNVSEPSSIEAVFPPGYPAGCSQADDAGFPPLEITALAVALGVGRRRPANPRAGNR